MKNQNREVLVEYAGVENELINKNDTVKEFVYAMDSFSQDADPKNPKEHRSYVYALCEEVKENTYVPFYIGEGKGARVWAHELDEEKQLSLLEETLKEEGRLDELEERKKELTEKIKKIREIKDRKGEIKKLIIKWGMTSKEAFMVEAALINLLRMGKLKFNTTCRDNLTNKVKGHMSKGEEQTGSNEIRTVEQFCEEFAKAPLYYEDLVKAKVPAVLININKGFYKYCENLYGEARQKAIKDAVCGNWKLLPSNFAGNKINYVFATVDARVVGIFKIKTVKGKKVHFSYECVEEGSEYPHGKDTVVEFRNSDYKFAEQVVAAAKRKKKDPSEVVLCDMPEDYQKEFKNGYKKGEDPANEFKKAINRKYMILENLPKDDPNYDKFEEYKNRRIIHNEDYVAALKKQKEEKKRNRKKKEPNKVINQIYGQGQPIKYIKEDDIIKSLKNGKF